MLIYYRFLTIVDTSSANARISVNRLSRSTILHIFIPLASGYIGVISYKVQLSA